jgi:hypothetical protein
MDLNVCLVSPSKPLQSQSPTPEQQTSSCFTDGDDRNNTFQGSSPAGTFVCKLCSYKPQLWRPLGLSSCLPGRWKADMCVLLYCWDTGLLCSSAYEQNAWRCVAFCDLICSQICSLFSLYFCFVVREKSVWFCKASVCVSASVRPCMTPPPIT